MLSAPGRRRALSGLLQLSLPTFTEGVSGIRDSCTGHRRSDASSPRSVDEGRLRISACQLWKSFRRSDLSCTHRLIRAVNGQDQTMP